MLVEKLWWRIWLADDELDDQALRLSIGIPTKTHLNGDLQSLIFSLTPIVDSTDQDPIPLQKLRSSARYSVIPGHSLLV